MHFPAFYVTIDRYFVLTQKGVFAMPNQPITVAVNMDRKQLRSFALFDAFTLKKRWKKPVLFATILTVFSIVCFMLTSFEQNRLLGTVLLAIGLGLPIVYVLMFLIQIGDEVKKLQLKKPRKVYTLVFSNEKITVTNNLVKEDPITLEWQKLPVAFRRKNAIYLYVTRARAFVLPAGQADASDDELWAMFERNMQKGRARG